MAFTLLKELALETQHCKIKVKISRIWESTTPQLKKDFLSLDCLLIDEEAYAMQATIRKYDAKHLRGQLSEGNVYVIEKFNVVPSRSSYKVVDRKYMIQISKWTRIARAEDTQNLIPAFSFHFLKFDYIKNKRHTDGFLIDVLGSISTIGPVSQIYVGQELTLLRNLEIRDLEHFFNYKFLYDLLGINIYLKFVPALQEQNFGCNFMGQICH